MPVAQTRLESLQICKLLQCVREEDKIQIKKLVDSGVPHLVNYNEPGEGETALTIAAVQNNDSMIEFLLEIGAHPNVVDFKGRTAAMRASEYGHVQCLEALCKGTGEVKADMKVEDLEGKGIIFYCVSPTQRHSKCLQIALMYGANVNNKSKDGIPVFVYACESANENEEMALALLERGADPNVKYEKQNRTALMAACKSGSIKVVQAILQKGAAVNEIMVRPKHHAAHEAAKGGFLDCLQALSAYGATFDQYDEAGNNPIHIAATNGHAMCCKFLSQRGCNPKPKNTEGNQPKGLAKDNGHKEAAKECRKSEKSFGKTGKNNDPWALALYDFCCERSTELLDIFKKYDADAEGTIQKEDLVDALESMEAPMPEENDIKKITMAHEAGRGAGINYEEFLTGKKYVNKQYLMSAFEGKKKKKKGGKKGGKKGKTKIPMVICTQADGPRTEDGGPPEVYVSRHIHYTDTNRFDRDDPPKHPLQDDSGWYITRPEKNYMNINDAAKHADLDTLRDAFERGVSVDIRDKYFKTPLMIACVNGSLNVVKFLVERGANVNAQDNFKWAPLHFACHAGMKDIIEYLLEKGANMEATTLNGATPLMRAIEGSKAEVVQYLIDSGAKVQVENRKGQNPVDIAAAYSDFRVYDIVKAKFDSLPPPADKKKGAKGAAKGGKRPKSSASGGGDKPPPTAPTQDEGRGGGDDVDGHPQQHRKGSILRAASALAGGIEEQEDITYTPIKTWTDQKSKKALINDREVRRDRYTWEVDFHDFKMPFLKNVDQKVIELGGFDDDD